MKIAIHGGANEIGGNKILLEHKNTRILLDYGSSLGYESSFFSEFVAPRTNTRLADRLEIGALPKIPGVYREDLLRPHGYHDLNNTEYSRVLNPDHRFFQYSLPTYEDYRKQHQESYVDAILLSHAHLDHTGGIAYLHPSISLVCSDETKTLVESIDAVTTFKSGAIVSNGNHIAYTKKGLFPHSPKIAHDPSQRLTNTLKDQEKTMIKDFEVTHFLQDHSVPGASSFTITTPEGQRVLYTGDIRFHGRLDLSIEEYATRVGDIDVMLCEGTRIDSDHIITEGHVEKGITDEIESTKGLVFVDFSWKDTTRYETIKQAAKKSGRTFVINARLAYLLENLGIAPDENDPVSVFLKRKGSCLYSPDDYSKSKHEYGLTTDFNTNFDDSHYQDGLTADDIIAAPQDYILMMSYYDFNQLFDLADSTGKIPNSRFIKAQCAPFSDDMELDEERLINWLKTFNVSYELDAPPKIEGCTNPSCPKLRPRIKRQHVSGHVSGPELRKLIHNVQPDILIPIHTEHPELFEPIVAEAPNQIQLKIPQSGSVFTL